MDIRFHLNCLHHHLSHFPILIIVTTDSVRASNGAKASSLPLSFSFFTWIIPIVHSHDPELGSSLDY